LGENKNVESLSLANKDHEEEKIRTKSKVRTKIKQESLSKFVKIKTNPKAFKKVDKDRNVQHSVFTNKWDEVIYKTRTKTDHKIDIENKSAFKYLPSVESKKSWLKVKYFDEEEKHNVNLPGTELLTDAQKSNIGCHDPKNYNLFHFSQKFTNRDIFTSQASLAEISRSGDPLKNPHGVIDIKPQMGNADVHFEHNFEKRMDFHRWDFAQRKACNLDINALMIQLKSYLEIFSMYVYKYSTLIDRSKYMFDTFHDMKEEFKNDETLDIAWYPNHGEGSSEFYEFNQICNIIVKIVPFSRDDRKTIYMMFSLNVLSDQIILIPALSHSDKDKDQSRRLKEFEGIFIDILALVWCAMNIPLIVECHEETFEHWALNELWQDLNLKNKLDYLPMIDDKTPIKFFNYGRKMLGEFCKLRRFAGLHILWGEKFKKTNNDDEELWKTFLNYGSLRVSKANYIHYVRSSAENSEEGGWNRSWNCAHIRDWEFESLTKEANKLYFNHLQMRNISVLDYIKSDIQIDDLDSLSEIIYPEDIVG
jgi:hypothetical protein